MYWAPAASHEKKDPQLGAEGLSLHQFKLEEILQLFFIIAGRRFLHG